MKPLPLAERGARISVLCLGAHSDDIEIGVWGTVLGWISTGVELDVCWCMLSAQELRRQEAMAAAKSTLEGGVSRRIELADFRDSYFPYQGDEIKSWIENLKTHWEPRYRVHASQRRWVPGSPGDFTAELGRDSRQLVLEYEIQKWDGDLGQPNVYVAMSAETSTRKSKLLETSLAPQRSNDCFDAGTFRGLARLRGME
jgi:LmbE family N-acetylglucosaminyl deacetylase